MKADRRNPNLGRSQEDHNLFLKSEFTEDFCFGNRKAVTSQRLILHLPSHAFPKPLLHPNCCQSGGDTQSSSPGEMTDLVHNTEPGQAGLSYQQRLRAFPAAHASVMWQGA